MEYEGIIYQSSNGELKHWGVKGMHWGVRRYQNPDGSLTALGKKRRGQGAGADKKNSEKSAKRKEEKQTDKQAKIEAARKKTAEKIEKTKATLERVKAKRMLKQEKNELKKLNKKIEQEKQAEKDKTKLDKDAEKLKAKLLKSSDAAEIYKHRDLFTTAELNERLSRIDTERRLANVANTNKKSFLDRVDTGIKIGRKVNEVYELSNSSVGKALKKQFGLEKESEIDKHFNNILSKAATMPLDDLKSESSRYSYIKNIMGKNNKNN